MRLQKREISLREAIGEFTDLAKKEGNVEWADSFLSSLPSDRLLTAAKVFQAATKESLLQTKVCFVFHQGHSWVLSVRHVSGEWLNLSHAHLEFSNIASQTTLYFEGTPQNLRRLVDELPCWVRVLDVRDTLEKTFQGEDFSGVLFTGEWTGCRFQDCIFSEQTPYNAVLVDCEVSCPK